MAIELTNISSGYNLSAINENFQKIEDVVNGSLLWKTGSVAGETLMLRDIDMNGHTLLNLAADPNNPGSILTIEVADGLYYNIKGDTLEGDMSAGGYNITGIGIPVAPSDAVRKQDLDAESSARQGADANLQEQITGDIPLEASAFSEISWHGQQILNSVTIPANKNAWSFGPQMEIAEGQAVTVSVGSSWTVADGRVVEDEDLHNLIADTIRTVDGTKTVQISDVASGTDLTALTSRVTTEENKVNSIEQGGTAATTASQARINLSAAASGANTDITSITGSAAKLTTARTVQTNLASTAPASFNGSANITPGVSGILPIANGGTGNATGLAASATQLATARTFQTNLASTSAASFNGTASVTPGVTGTLAIGNGGTGATTAAAARTSLGVLASAGVVDASNAAAGVVGEVLSATATTVSLSNGVATNVVSLALTAGDWDLSGAVSVRPTSATIAQIISGASTTSATNPVFPNRIVDNGSFTFVQEYAIPSQRFNITATTTVYLVTSAGFPSGTVTADGYLLARRRR